MVGRAPPAQTAPPITDHNQAGRRTDELQHGLQRLLALPMPRRVSVPHTEIRPNASGLWASSTCPSHRVAVMIVGELDAPAFHSFIVSSHWLSHERHVVRPLTNNATAAVDTFICANSKVEQLPANILNRLQVRVATSISKARSLTHRQTLCFEAAQEWQQQQQQHDGALIQCTFSHYLWTRFDHEWFADAPPPSALPTDALALRARLVIGDVAVSTDMMSWLRCGMYTGTGGRLCGSAATTVAKAREDGHNQTSNKECVILDDQVGIVPANLAHAFFASHAFGQDAFGQDGVLPKTNRSPAVTVHVPVPPGETNLSSRAAESEVTEHTWNVCPGTCWQWQINSGEGRISHRLAHKRLPVRLTPMRVRLPKINRHGKIAFHVAQGAAPWVRCPS